MLEHFNPHEYLWFKNNSIALWYYLLQIQDALGRYTFDDKLLVEAWVKDMRSLCLHAFKNYKTATPSSLKHNISEMKSFYNAISEKIGAENEEGQKKYFDMYYYFFGSTASEDALLDVVGRTIAMMEKVVDSI